MEISENKYIYAELPDGVNKENVHSMAIYGDSLYVMERNKVWRLVLPKKTKWEKIKEVFKK